MCRAFAFKPRFGPEKVEGDFHKSGPKLFLVRTLSQKVPGGSPLGKESNYVRKKLHASLRRRPPLRLARPARRAPLLLPPSPSNARRRPLRPPRLPWFPPARAARPLRDERRPRPAHRAHRRQPARRPPRRPAALQPPTRRPEPAVGPQPPATHALARPSASA